MQYPAESHFSWPEAFVWLAASVLVALAVGWIATLVAERFAPLVIFPLAVGAVLAAALVGTAGLFPACNRLALLTGVLLGSLVAVSAQHGFSYLNAVRKMRQSETIADAQQAFGEALSGRLPRDPFDYLRMQATIGRPMPLGCVARGAAAWLSWAADGLLLVCAAGGVFLVSRKKLSNRGSPQGLKKPTCPT